MCRFTLPAAIAASAVAALGQTVSIPIQNASFEEPAIPFGGYATGPLPGWEMSQPTWGGVFHVTGSQFPGGAPDGANTHWSNGGAIGQTLDAVWEADLDYVFTIHVGDRLDGAGFGGFSLVLLAGAQEVARSDDPFVPPHGGFEIAYTNFKTIATDPFLGQPIGIRVETHGVQTNYDLARLTARTPGCAGDVDGDGDTDVFDFADLAANFGAGPGATRAMGDLTGDGDIDVFDFAELAADFGCAS